jgi:hypothetical protein
LGRVVWFIVQLSFPASALLVNCYDISTWGTICFYGCAFPATAVLIMKATAILSPKTQLFMRLMNFVALVTSFGFSLSGTIYRTISVNPNGYCSIFYYRIYNMTSKAIFFGIYCTLLACFLIPSVRYLNAVQSPHIGQSLRLVTLQMSIKISIAIAVFLIAVLIAFANAWGI